MAEELVVRALHRSVRCDIRLDCNPQAAELSQRSHLHTSVYHKMSHVKESGHLGDRKEGRFNFKEKLGAISCEDVKWNYMTQDYI